MYPLPGGNRPCTTFQVISVYSMQLNFHTAMCVVYIWDTSLWSRQVFTTTAFLQIYVFNFI